MKQNIYAIQILNVLMRHNRFMSTTEICNTVQCERKTVYSNIARLECCGFPINVIKNKENWYEYSGIVCDFQP